MIREILHWGDVDTGAKLHKMNWECMCFDTETTSLRQDELEITGISLCDGEFNFYLPILPRFRKSIMIYFIDLFNQTKKLIAHNIVFDLRVLAKYDIEFSPKVKLFDTMVAHHLINENDRHGLKYLTKTLLNREVEEYNENLSHYCEEFYKYGLDDSYNTWLLYELFLPQLKEEGLEYLFHKIEMPFQYVLLEMALEGVLIDQDRAKEILNLVTDAEQEFIGNMLDFAGIKYYVQTTLEKGSTIISPINFNSPVQLRPFLFETIGLKPSGHKTKTGSDKTGKELIESYKLGVNEDGSTSYSHAFIPIYSKYKIASKIHSMYKSLPNFIQQDGKLRPNFNDTGTKTGRLSCSEINLQQLPKAKADFPVNVREVFKAPEGYKMFSCDYSGQEVAVMAQQSKDPTLVKSLNNGYDMHLAVANTFYNLNIPEEALSKKHKDYEQYKEKYGKMRSQAKTITFGLAYGKGAYGFAKDFNVDEEEAQEMVDNYFKGMSKLKEAIAKAHKEVEETGLVTHMGGRKRHFFLNKDSEFFEVERAKRQSFNFQIQGFSADMIRAAAINVYRRNKVKEWGLKSVMTVHDEFVYIVKEQYVKEATEMVKKAFEDTCKNFVVPVNADIEIGENYGNSK